MPGDYRMEKPSPRHVHSISDWPNHTTSPHPFPNTALACALARYGSENRGNGRGWDGGSSVGWSSLSSLFSLLLCIRVERSTHGQKCHTDAEGDPVTLILTFSLLFFIFLSLFTPGHVFFIFWTRLFSHCHVFSTSPLILAASAVFTRVSPVCTRVNPLFAPRLYPAVRRKVLSDKCKCHRAQHSKKR
jgi:hypothetical protein